MTKTWQLLTKKYVGLKVRESTTGHFLSGFANLYIEEVSLDLHTANMIVEFPGDPKDYVGSDVYVVVPEFGDDCFTQAWTYPIVFLNPKVADDFSMFYILNKSPFDKFRRTKRWDLVLKKDFSWN